jgi:hypothetical protein
MGIRIILDQTDFEKLTRGEVIKKDTVEIALSDIGYYNMTDILDKNFKKTYADFKEQGIILDADNEAFIANLKEKLGKLKK